MLLNFEVFLKNIKDISVISIEHQCEISSLYKIQLKTIINTSKISIDEIPGEDISIKITFENKETKWLCGIVTFIKMESAYNFSLNDTRNAVFAITIEPKLALLRNTNSYKIFQNQTTNHIVKEILSQHKIDNTNLASKFGNTEREFCVQYNESDLNFICRIMEEEGIFFHFTHEFKKHTMVINDNNKQVREFAGEVYMQNHSEISSAGKIIDFSNENQIIQKENEMLSFDSEKTVKLQKDSCQTAANKKYGVMTEDYTSRIVSSVGKTSNIHSEIYDAQFAHFFGKSTCFDISEASNIHVKDSPVHSIDNKKYFIIQYKENFRSSHNNFHSDFVSDSASDFNSYSNSEHTHPEYTYYNEFISIPSTTPFRPKLKTPIPNVSLETATVIGNKNNSMENKDDYVYTNENGEIKVKFHWDQSKEEDSSCWIRVMQKSSGNAFGTLQLPRVGQEVVVSFIKNNPNKPIIMGSVYNGKNKPKYLKTSQTVDYWASQSVGSTNPNDRNEIKFENKQEREKIEMHAQKDMSVEVLNNFSHDNKQNYDLNIEEGYYHVVVNKGDCLLQLNENNILIDVKKGKITVKSFGDIEFFSENNIKLNAKKNIEMVAEENIIQTAKQNFFIKAENYDSQIHSKHSLNAKNVEEKANDKMELIAQNTNIKSHSTLNMQNSTTNIKSTNCNIDSSISCKINTNSVDIKGKAKANLQATGEVTVKGIVVKLG